MRSNVVSSRTFEAILDWNGPVYMRIGRSPAPVIFGADHTFRIGKATRVREGDDLTIVATGVMVARAITASERLRDLGISVRVVNLSTIKPLDGAELLAAAMETRGILTAEDHNIRGGMGSAVAEFLAERCPTRIRFIGVEDRFGRSGEPDELARLFGLTDERMVKEGLTMIGELDRPCVS